MDEERALALAMSTHPRLGSRLGSLGMDTLEYISQLVDLPVGVGFTELRNRLSARGTLRVGTEHATAHRGGREFSVQPVDAQLQGTCYLTVQKERGCDMLYVCMGLVRPAMFVEFISQDDLRRTCAEIEDYLLHPVPPEAAYDALRDTVRQHLGLVGDKWTFQDGETGHWGEIQKRFRLSYNIEPYLAYRGATFQVGFDPEENKLLTYYEPDGGDERAFGKFGLSRLGVAQMQERLVYLMTGDYEALLERLARWVEAHCPGWRLSTYRSSRTRGRNKGRIFEDGDIDTGITLNCSKQRWLTLDMPRETEKVAFAPRDVETLLKPYLLKAYAAAFAPQQFAPQQ